MKKHSISVRTKEGEIKVIDGYKAVHTFSCGAQLDLYIVKGIYGGWIATDFNTGCELSTRAATTRADAIDATVSHLHYLGKDRYYQKLDLFNHAYEILRGK